MKKKYKMPTVNKQVTVRLETRFLDSVVNPSTKIETAGQTVDKRDFSESSFNSTWE